MIFAAIVIHQVSCSPMKSKSIVNDTEVNNPWMVINPSDFLKSHTYSLMTPFVDTTNPNILYLAEASDNPEALKIDLINRTVSSHNFNVSKWNDILKIVVPYKCGFNPNDIDDKNQIKPFHSEFHGKTFPFTYTHQYGYPFPTHSKERTAIFGSGTRTLVDHRDNYQVELMRYSFTHVEMALTDFYYMDFGISPNKKWMTYRMPVGEQLIFIFNRAIPEAKSPHWQSYRNFIHSNSSH